MSTIRNIVVIELKGEGNSFSQLMSESQFATAQEQKLIERCSHGADHADIIPFYNAKTDIVWHPNMLTVKKLVELMNWPLPKEATDAIEALDKTNEVASKAINDYKAKVIQETNRILEEAKAISGSAGRNDSLHSLLYSTATDLAGGIIAGDLIRKTFGEEGALGAIAVMADHIAEIKGPDDSVPSDGDRYRLFLAQALVDYFTSKIAIDQSPVMRNYLKATKALYQRSGVGVSER